MWVKTTSHRKGVPVSWTYTSSPPGPYLLAYFNFVHVSLAVLIASLILCVDSYLHAFLKAGASDRNAKANPFSVLVCSGYYNKML